MMRYRGLVVLVALSVLVAASCSRSDTKTSAGPGGSSAAPQASSSSGPDCTKEAPKATEVGVTADSITVEVMADVGSSLAPGLFQGNLDGVSGFADFVNAHGGIACRKLVVKQWDTKLDSNESKNGQIDACQNALAMVGSNALFNPDASTLVSCKDLAGQATGLPDLAALAADKNQACNPTTFLIQAANDNCEHPEGVREIPAAIGATAYLLKQEKNLHGAFLIPGDLPTTVQASMTQIAAQKNAGINLNQTPKVSGFSEQSAYTPIVQQLRADQSNYLYDGSNDKAMVNARKEAKAQGVDSVKYWMCSLACYTDAFLTSGGADVEGTYASMQFLPFEDKGSNAELDAFLDNVKKADSWAAQSWQAATVFKQLIDGIVAKSGVNGITRASLLDALKNAGEVDAGGWMGKKTLRGTSSCVVVLQVQSGKWARVFPTEKGTMDCTSANLTTVSLDPVAEAAKLG
jgi:hypothetical protein